MYVSIDFLRWAMTVWIYGDIHMCGVASLIVRKLWGVTQIWLMILVRLWKTFRTAFYRDIRKTPFERSFKASQESSIKSASHLKLWGVTQIWLMILVRLWKTFRTAFSVCLYRLFFEVEKAVRKAFQSLTRIINQICVTPHSYDCLNIWWYTHVWNCLTNCEETVRCDADLIDDSCEALKDLSNGFFRISLSTFWGELWLFEYMVIYTCVELPH